MLREIIDEVQPVLPCSSVPRAAVIGVAQLTVTSPSFETLEEKEFFTFSNKDSSGMESPSVCDKLSNDQLQGGRREVKKSNAIIVIILLVVLAVKVAALFACGFWPQEKEIEEKKPSTVSSSAPDKEKLRSIPKGKLRSIPFEKLLRRSFEEQKHREEKNYLTI